MRILQVSDYFPDYGAGIVDTLARRLASWGHEVLVIAGTVNQVGRYYSRGWKTLSSNLSLFRFSTFGLSGSGTSFSLPTPNLPALVRIIRKFNPDVANLHFAPHFGNVLLGPFLRIQAVPIFFTLHGVATGYPTLPLHAASILVNGIASFPIRLADRVITVSEEVSRIAERIYGINPSKTFVIPNGIDADRFLPSSKEFDPQTLCIGFCGRLSAPKNVGSLITALHILREQFGIDATGIIAGDGPSRRNLVSLAASLSVPVKFTGQLSHGDQIVSFYHAIDFLAHPSTVEGLPQSVLEAMSCKVPVVARAIGGVKDVLIDGWNGIALKSGCTDELATAVLNLSRDTPLRERISENERITILSSHSDVVMCKRYLQAYESVSRK